MIHSNITGITVILSAVSLVAGFIDSIAGGGGLLLLPAIILAGLPPQTALGTNKFASTSGTSIALLNFIRNKKVVWRIAGLGVLFTLFGSFLGTKTILILPNQTVGKLIILLLPLAMLATLIPRNDRDIPEETLPKKIFLKVPLICFTIGFYDGFFGPGTGSFLIIALYIFVGLNLVEASATAKVFNLASNIGALVVFLLDGKVLFFLGIPLAVANIIGNYLGSMLVVKKGTFIVRVFLLIAIIILLGTLIWKYFVK